MRGGKPLEQRPGLLLGYSEDVLQFIKESEDGKRRRLEGGKRG